jgi:hypothetical protein
MIKTLLLIFDPTHTWDKIEKAPQRGVTVFLQFLLPLLLLTSAVEALALVEFGERRGAVIERIVKVPVPVAVRYAVAQVTLTLVILFLGAWGLQQIGSGFHRRHTYTECFTTLAYSLGPLLLLRMLDAAPAINTWICWGIGIALSISVLYRGVPRIMRPDPSNALGLYLVSALVLILATGLAHFVEVLVLEEKILASGA